MELLLSEILPADFAANSRVWIYQSSRLFGMAEAFELEQMFEEFVATWKSHGSPVKGYANLFYGQFIIIMADENVAKVGGCSTDSSVHFIQEIEQKFKVDLFNRQTLAFFIEGKVQLLPLAHFNHAVSNGYITENTLYFNNLVSTKATLISDWCIPAGNSWLGVRIKANKANAVVS